MGDMNKYEQLAKVQEVINELTPQIESVTWRRGKPSSNELVLFAEYYRALVGEAWLKGVDVSFVVEKIGEITGLSEHDMNVYMEIGGWVSMDRKAQALPEEDRERLWNLLNSLDPYIKATVDAEVQEQKDARQKEIDELNRLFGDQA